MSAIRWPFVLGLVMAALGGCLVTLYRPLPAPAKPPADAANPANRPVAVNSAAPDAVPSEAR